MQIRVGLIIHERLCVIHLYAGRIKRNMFSRNWRRKWQPTPVCLPGKSRGRRSLVATFHEVAKSRTRLSNFTFTFTLVENKIQRWQ